MKKIKYNIRIEDSLKTHVDALLDKTIFEYKYRVRDLRMLNTTVINLVRILSELLDHTCVLILDETSISRSRLSLEWQTLTKLFKPSIFSRLRMIVFCEGETTESFGEFSNYEKEVMFEIKDTLSRDHVVKGNRKRDAFYEILWILLVYWFRRSGALQVNQLCQISGFSYPAVASALDKLGDKLTRHSDRSVELKSFPKSDWLKLLTMNDDIKESHGFWALRPKPVENLKNRLLENPHGDIAFGGIIGARHYLPGIDLVGIHRLDISVHNWNTREIDMLRKKLDPGLKKIEPGKMPQVVIHNLHRPDTLYLKGEEVNIADEVECLLNLHEARLDRQYNEFLEHLKNQPTR
ncbi:MAG: hypothetical protein IH596_03915 [Bacteroidales bacterium]|nr:hypothetical protein [Bacteroidales bacterium]